MGSCLRPFVHLANLLLSEPAKYAAKVKSSSSGLHKCFSRLWFCTRCYFSRLRYFTKQNYIFVFPT
jgi:hypothetical protein